jgi:SAM-dependent methyltransferase
MAFDWEEFYADDDWDRGAYLAGEDMPDYLDRFFDAVGRPDTVLSVGCGPAYAEFVLADRHPEVEWTCVDVSPSVVDANRATARAEGLDTLTFAVDSLPDLAVEGSFDLVYCMAVLYFVRDVEPALQALYDRVAAGGHLVCNYANRHTRAWVRNEAPERKREAFSLVLEGANLLSYDRIESVLGTRPRPYWRAVDADDDLASGNTGPTAVYLPK